MSPAYELAARPDLSRFPRSASLVYDVIAAATTPRGYCSLSLASICSITRLSAITVRRAMRRLVAARMLRAAVGCGRGHVSRFFVRAFSIARKAAYYLLFHGRRSFPQERGNPSPPAPYPENVKINLKTPARERLASRGQILGAARRVLDQNHRLSPPARSALLGTLGRMLFHEQFYPALARRNGAVAGLLSKFAAVSRQTPESRNSSRVVYAWARWWLIGALTELWATPAAELLDAFGLYLEQFSTSPSSREDAGAKISRQRSIAGQRRPLLSRRRKTWNEKGQTPSWAVS